jgi:hypothetical protein
MGWTWRSEYRHSHIVKGYLPLTYSDHLVLVLSPVLLQDALFQGALVHVLSVVLCHILLRPVVTALARHYPLVLDQSHVHLRDGVSVLGHLGRLHEDVCALALILHVTETLERRLLVGEGILPVHLVRVRHHTAVMDIEGAPVEVDRRLDGDGESATVGVGAVAGLRLEEREMTGAAVGEVQAGAATEAGP